MEVRFVLERATGSMKMFWKQQRGKQKGSVCGRKDAILRPWRRKEDDLQGEPDFRGRQEASVL